MNADKTNVYSKSLSFAVFLKRTVRSFPRDIKYSYGVKICELSALVVKDCLRANREKTQEGRLNFIERAIDEITLIESYCNICTEDFLHSGRSNSLSPKIDIEVGNYISSIQKQLEGWRKYTASSCMKP